MQDTLSNTSAWFDKAVANPTSKNMHTQLGCHFEEINEMVMVLVASDFETQILLDTAKSSLNALANHLKAMDNVIHVRLEDREEFLDSICDQIVTGTGCAHMVDMDVVGGLNEVNRSNFSKFDLFEDPIFDPNMKVTKGPYYSKPDLSPYV